MSNKCKWLHMGDAIINLEKVLRIYQKNNEVIFDCGIESKSYYVFESTEIANEELLKIYDLL